MGSPNTRSRRCSRSRYMHGQLVALGVVERRDVGHRAVRHEVRLDRPARRRGHEARPRLAVLHDPGARLALAVEDVAEQVAARALAVRRRPREQLRRAGRDERVGVDLPVRVLQRDPDLLRRGSRTGTPARRRAARTARPCGRPTPRSPCAPRDTGSDPNDALWSLVKHTTSQRPTAGRCGHSGLPSTSDATCRRRLGERREAVLEHHDVVARRRDLRSAPGPAGWGTAGSGRRAACTCGPGGARRSSPTRR